jgi:hypothetical protein
MVRRVVLPAIAVAENEFGAALSRVSVDDLVNESQIVDQTALEPKPAVRQ